MTAAGRMLVIYDTRVSSNYAQQIFSKSFSNLKKCRINFSRTKTKIAIHGRL